MSGTKGARGRRFEGGLAPDAAELNASVGFDWRLLPHDVEGSIAHARMLGRQGIIPTDDVEQIVTGLRAVQGRLERGEVDWDTALEDVHMNVEARLIDDVGDAGRRLHTGRSRNDQVATDLRLYARAAAARLVAAIDRLRAALVGQARRHVDTLMPGYTHLQRAQPVRAAHHFLAYEAMLGRDRGRLVDAARRAGESPLGSGALAATTFPIDREGVAADLGFAGVTHNSLDAVGDRDFAIELVAACALCQVHLSRLGEELVLWLSQEFRFARLPDAYCSGSSLMPQKKNPDLAELVRGKTGRVMGDWVTLMTVVKGLPLAYNKDLQETQEPLYDAVETLEASLGVCAGMVDALELDVARLRVAVGEGHLVATELADYLVARGLPFRDAHDVAGALVRRALDRGVELAGLSLEELREVHPLFDDDVYGWLDPARAVDRRDVVGGPARGRVVAEIARVEADLAATAAASSEARDTQDV
ncbi:MAG: argininosuccinate lyase [Kofleriaceae bacterium]|nr:argininosuccinate lyase [Myxococcales bacterium]MCB9559346.1 argininosuccinate lyase [Kofleriaceae bacterium]MCB9574030.1 argininosuccinate lyase [Kofleriaceae bacterium]